MRTDLPERLCYSRDLSVHEAVPDVIVFAETTDDISKILTLANKEKIHVTPRGSGTSAVGGALAAKGGVLLDLSRMNKILEIEKEGDGGARSPDAGEGRARAVPVRRRVESKEQRAEDPSILRVSAFGSPLSAPLLFRQGSR